MVNKQLHKEMMKDQGSSKYVEYKGRMIPVESKETRYFSSYSTYPRSEAVKYAEKEMKTNPILKRYTITKHAFPATSAYPKGVNYEVEFYYYQPKNTYFDYGTDIKGARKYLKEFSKKKHQPLYPYAVSSVERNMEHASLIGALETVHATNKTKARMIKVFEHRNKITPYTNWSGD